MISRLIYLLIVLTLCVISYKGHSQAAVNVDISTGAGYVAVPLCTVSEHDISVGLSLSYTTKGIRLIQSNGVVGVGWSLNAVGGISREIRGLPDDFPVGGWVIGQNAAHIQSFTPSDQQPCNENSQWTSINAFGYTKDTEPDIYSINLPTISGQFIFDANKNVKFLSHNDARIIPAFNTSGKITSFTATDVNGTEYILNILSTETKDANTFNASFYKKEYEQYKNSLTYTTAWHPSEMTSLRNNTISFTYVDRVLNDSVFISKTLGFEPEYIDKTFKVFYDGQLYNTMYYNLSQTHKLLTGISGPSFTLSLNYYVKAGHNSEYLHDITITKGSSTTTVNFLYDEIEVTIEEDRVFLESINRVISKGTETITLPATTFEYHKIGNGITNVLPTVSSKQYDYWGYFNNSKEHLDYPKLYVYPSLAGDEKFRLFKLSSSYYTGYEYILDGNDRRMNAAAAMSGNLKKITLPEGGSHFFFYEANKFNDNVSGELREGAGLRVSKWITYDGVDNANDIIRTYTYDPGKLFYPPKYYIPTSRNGATTYDDLLSSGQDLYEQLLARTDRNIAAEESYVLYPKVTVSNNGFGKSVYYFTTPGFFPSTTDTGWEAAKIRIARKSTGNSNCFKLGLLSTGYYSFPFPENPNYNYYQGHLSKEEHFNSGNSLLKKIEYTYLPLNPNGFSQLYSLPYQEVQTYYGSGTGEVYSTMFLYSKVPLNLNKGYYPDQVTTTTYDPNNLTQSIVEVQDFDYGLNHINPTTVSSTNSDGTIYYSKSKYIKDYNLTGTLSPELAALNHLKTGNINLPIENVKERKDPAQIVKITSASINIYEGTSPGDVNLKNSRIINKAILSSSFSYSGVTGTSPKSLTYDNDYELVAEVISKDGHQNIESIIGRNKVINTTIYGHNGKYPVLQATHAKANEILFSDATERGFSLITTSSRSLSNYSPYTGDSAIAMPVDAVEDTYLNASFHAGGNKYTLSFWSHTSKTYTVKIYNASFTTLLTSVTFSSGTVGIWAKVIRELDLSAYQNQDIGIRIFPQSDTVVDDVLLIPEKCQYSATSFDQAGRITSTTDQNMKPVFYKYDATGRLLWVKDHNQNIINYNEFGTR